MSHRESTTTIIVLTLLACLLAAVAPASADGVSPGAPDHIAAVDQRCPTFIWELVEHTLYYEVVAYVLPEHLSDEAVFEASLEGAEEVLYTRVPGGAAGWTPPADRALAPGGRYVWFVRAVYEHGDGEDVKAGEWSRGHFFRVAEGPSAAELASALANQVQVNLKTVLQDGFAHDGAVAAHVPRRSGDIDVVVIHCSQCPRPTCRLDGPS